MEEELINFYNLLNEANQLCTRLLIITDQMHDLVAGLVPQIDRTRWLVDYCKNFAAQRTPEWFRLRNGCITASDIGATLKTDKYQSTAALIRKKAGTPKPFANIYTKWGNKYEDIAVAIYERIHDVKVFEASLLIHPIFSFIGASCDGFVIDEKNNDAWLIEIKCPFSRDPVGKIPSNYIEQPRTQMACTKINKCSFFECKLVEFNTRDDALEDTTVQFKGVLVEYNLPDIMDVDNEPMAFHIYPPNIRAGINNEEFEQMVSDIIGELNRVEESGLKMKNIKFVYWGLVKQTEDIIMRDPDWIHSNVERIEYVWEQIKHYRRVGADKIPARINI